MTIKKAVLAFALAIPILSAAVLLIPARPAYAHTATKAGDINMEVGWGIEPPLIGQMNTITVEVTRISDGKPVANAFADAKVTVIKGGDSKDLEILPGEKEGLYAGQIIPTQLGQITVDITGTIAGQKVDNKVQIEDVEDTKTLTFPVSSSSGSGSGPSDGGQGVPQGFVDQMRSVVSDLTTRIDNATTSAQNASNSAQQTAEDVSSLKTQADRSYIVGMAGIGVGVAGIVIAVRALSKGTKAI
ncbi:MAG TPA: hypothetical protein VHA09_04270 [Nitrososphaera sp.]|nr:hypothetical protein [Nitrososphaera sp.]